MYRVVITVLLALLVVLAGCNALPLGSDETPASTVTPAAIPTDDPNATRGLAPGLTRKGVVDSLVLAEAHGNMLRNMSHTSHKNTVIRYTNGTVYNRMRVHSQFVADKKRLYTVQNESGTSVRGSNNISIWSNSKRILVAQTSNNTTSYLAPPQEPRISGITGNRIEELFGSVETRIVGQRQRNRMTVYRVEATRVTIPGILARDGKNPRNVTLQALISPRGLVHEYRLSYEATLNGDPVQVHEQVRYTNLGNTTVECPSWYGEAIENVTTMTPTVAS